MVSIYSASSFHLIILTLFSSGNKIHYPSTTTLLTNDDGVDNLFNDTYIKLDSQKVKNNYFLENHIKYITL